MNALPRNFDAHLLRGNFEMEKDNDILISEIEEIWFNERRLFKNPWIFGIEKHQGDFYFILNCK